MNREKPILAFVVPCFNEAECINSTIESLRALINTLKLDGLVHQSSFSLYIDDGSRDNTWENIKAQCSNDPYCKGIKLAGNVGHQNALLAGMMEIRNDVDCIISLDADLQDDISVIPVMIDRFITGYDIVYGVRDSRESDSDFKRITAKYFYRAMELLNVTIVPQHADYRLVSKILDALSLYTERNLFLRGLFPIMGFRSTEVTYARKHRLHGQTKYPLRKMLSFAWQGITSFSSAPLRIAGFFSVCALCIAVLMSFITLVRWADGVTIDGWTSLMIGMLFWVRSSFFSLAVIGEYLGKIYLEVKQRPRYLVEEKA